MYLIKNLKFFLNDIDYAISKSFFYYQCSFRFLIKDLFNTIFSSNKFKRQFQIKRGNTKFNLDFNYEKNFTNRTLFSDYVKLEHLDLNLKKIILDNYDDIVSYLGKNFLYDNAIIYRNYTFSKEFYDYDIYSNIWHQDTHDGNRLLRIFLLINDVNESNGPLVVLDREETKKNWTFIKDRYTVHNKNSRRDFKNQIKFTGKSGDYLIVDTSNCMHRAGIPESQRDMLQITLYPNWMYKNGRKVFIK